MRLGIQAVVEGGRVIKEHSGRLCNMLSLLIWRLYCRELIAKESKKLELVSQILGEMVRDRSSPS